MQAAGLRHLPGLYLIEIERGGEVIPAAGPEEKLKGGDRLVFAGVTESVVDLQRIKGLVPATDQVFKLDSPAHRAHPHRSGGGAKLPDRGQDHPRGPVPHRI